MLAACARQPRVPAGGKSQALSAPCEVNADAVCREGCSLWRRLMPLSEQNAQVQRMGGDVIWSTELRPASEGKVLTGCQGNVNEAASVTAGSYRRTPFSAPDEDYLRRQGFCGGGATPARPPAERFLSREVSDEKCRLDADAICRHFCKACSGMDELRSFDVLAASNTNTYYYWSNGLSLPGGGTVDLLCTSDWYGWKVDGIAQSNTAIRPSDYSYLAAHGFCIGTGSDRGAKIRDTPAAGSDACREYSSPLLADAIAVAFPAPQ